MIARFYHPLEKFCVVWHIFPVSTGAGPLYWRKPLLLGKSGSANGKDTTIARCVGDRSFEMTTRTLLHRVRKFNCFRAGSHWASLESHGVADLPSMESISIAFARRLS